MKRIHATPGIRPREEMVKLVSNFPDLDRQWAGIKPDLSNLFQGVVISLSGGPDSTALLRALSEFSKRKKNFQMRAFHLNFNADSRKVRGSVDQQKNNLHE